MTVLKEANELAAHVMHLAKNEKVIPKRNFSVCAFPMLQTARDIYAKLLIANDRRLEIPD